jgi:uncharacterized protein YegP (UPF0339 family)
MAAKFEIFTDRKKQYRFHLKASNGEVIAASQAYENKAAKAAPVKRGSKAAAPAAEVKKPRSRKPKTE